MTSIENILFLIVEKQMIAKVLSVTEGISYLRHICVIGLKASYITYVKISFISLQFSGDTLVSICMDLFVNCVRFGVKQLHVLSSANSRFDACLFNQVNSAYL